MIRGIVRIGSTFVLVMVVMGAVACDKGVDAPADKPAPAQTTKASPASNPASSPASGPASAPAGPAKAQVFEGASEKKLYTVTLTPTPNPPPLNAIYKVEASVVDAKTKKPVEGAKVKVDATMPAHRHGMMTQPTHKEVGKGVYLSEGMKLHMPGAWVYRVDIEGPAGTDHAQFPYNQPAMSK